MTFAPDKNTYGPYDFSYPGDLKERLWFDSEKHLYYRESNQQYYPVRGVTTILKIIDKSSYLVPWAAKKVVEKLERIMPTVECDDWQTYTCCIPIQEFIRLLDSAKTAPRDILEDAGDVGQDAHRALEDAIQYAIRNTDRIVTKLVTQVTEPRAASCCAAALDWMNKHNVRWILTERKIYSRTFDFAGTMDGLATVDSCGNPACCPTDFKDRQSIIDWKSSNQLSETYLLQVAAYRAAYIEETEQEVTDAFILRLGKEDGKFEPWWVEEAELDSDFKGFVACQDLLQDYEEIKTRMATAKKQRTARKREAKAELKAEEKAAKVAAKKTLTKKKKDATVVRLQ